MMHSLLRLSAFEACGSCREKEMIEVFVVVSWHHMVVLLAVKLVMVLMTFDRSLRGLPIAAVLENNVLQTGRMSTHQAEKVPPWGP